MQRERQPQQHHHHHQQHAGNVTGRMRMDAAIRSGIVRLSQTRTSLDANLPGGFHMRQEFLFTINQFYIPTTEE